MIGSDGSTIDLVRMLEIGYGLVLGPIYGPITAFIGAVIGKMIKGGGIGLFFTPLAAVSTFVAAMIGRNKGKYWWVSAITLFALILGWYVFETGRIVWYYPIMHVAGLIILVALRGRISEWMWSGDTRMMSIGTLICSFCSTVAGHILGGLIFVVMLRPEPGLFTATIVISIVERIGISVGASFFARSLIGALDNMYPELLD